VKARKALGRRDAQDGEMQLPIVKRDDPRMACSNNANLNIFPNQQGMGSKWLNCVVAFQE
jgi:hypothetical protein